MPRHAIRAGDTVYVPGGVPHTFGPGTLVFEVQQTPDLGQFVIPDDLPGNPLSEAQWRRNIAETLDEPSREPQPRPQPGLAIAEGRNRRTAGRAGPHFALERWHLAEPHREPAHPRRCLTLTHMGAPATLRWSGGGERLERAESCILPAAIGEVTVVPDGEADLIACYLPDLARDVSGPLRSAGHDDATIAALGDVY